MKQLQTTITKGIFIYEQIARTEKNAIYQQRIGESGVIVSHEVFSINKNKEREIAGIAIAASESMPSDNQFGITAWSIRDYNKALDKYNSLVQLERLKELVK